VGWEKKRPHGCLFSLAGFIFSVNFISLSQLYFVFFLDQIGRKLICTNNVIKLNTITLLQSLALVFPTFSRLRKPKIIANWPRKREWAKEKAALSRERRTKCVAKYFAHRKLQTKRKAGKGKSFRVGVEIQCRQRREEFRGSPPRNSTPNTYCTPNKTPFRLATQTMTHLEPIEHCVLKSLITEPPYIMYTSTYTI